MCYFPTKIVEVLWNYNNFNLSFILFNWPIEACHQVLARAWTLLSLLWPNKKYMSSSKTCVIVISPLNWSIIGDQISEMLSLSCTSKKLTTETINLLRESPPQFSLLVGVRKGNPCSFKSEYRKTSNGVGNCGRWIADSRRKTHSIIIHA